MKAIPIDYRNETFESLQGRLAGLRLDVFKALQAYGPCTARQLARKANIDIVTLRPRVTELCQMGFAQLEFRNLPMVRVHEGIYRALSEAEIIAQREMKLV